MPRTPACWRPPERLPDLPPEEAVREVPFEVWGAPARFPPPTAPGFRRAQAAGLLPPPAPARPPSTVPGLTAWDRLLLALLAWFVLTPAVLIVGDLLDPGGAASLFCLLPVGAGVWLLLSTRAREAVEHAAGYTSGRTHAGLWRLARDGRVLREPDRTVPPPGWYPSPYFPGVLQRWDGPGWAPLPQRWWAHEDRYFRAPATPFL